MNERITQLLTQFGPDKKFIKDGYYRIRSISETEKEMSFLVPGDCGTSTVHPQITIYFVDNQWLPVKLLDMHNTPTQFIERNTETENFLDHSFLELVTLFEAQLS